MKKIALFVCILLLPSFIFAGVFDMVKSVAGSVVSVVTFVSVVVFTFTIFDIIGALLRLIAKWRTPIGKPEKRPQSTIQNGVYHFS